VSRAREMRLFTVPTRDAGVRGDNLVGQAFEHGQQQCLALRRHQLGERGHEFPLIMPTVLMCRMRQRFGQSPYRPERSAAATQGRR